MLLRIGPHGDGFGRRPDGLTLAKVQAAPHGIDLGPLQPRLREVINTESGRDRAGAAAMIDDLDAAARAHGGGAATACS